MALVLGATVLYVVLRVLGPQLTARPQRRWDAWTWRGEGNLYDTAPPHAPPIREYWY